MVSINAISVEITSTLYWKRGYGILGLGIQLLSSRSRLHALDKLLEFFFFFGMEMLVSKL